MDNTTGGTKDYVEFFNQGYTLAQTMPDLAAKIAKALDNSERSVGFRDGLDQKSMEKQKEKNPAWLKKDHSKGIDNNSGKEKSKDKDRDITPEI